MTDDDLADCFKKWSKRVVSQNSWIEQVENIVKRGYDLTAKNPNRMVGLLPKPAFYGLFESLKQKPGSNIIVFNPDEHGEPALGEQKENAPINSG